MLYVVAKKTFRVKRYLYDHLFSVISHNGNTTIQEVQLLCDMHRNVAHTETNAGVLSSIFRGHKANRMKCHYIVSYLLEPCDACHESQYPCVLVDTRL